jgi:hypothetical protein
MGLEEFRALADIQQARRITLRTEALQAGACFSTVGARLALNVVLLAADSLPSGGTISFAGDMRNDVMVLIEGPGAAWPARFATYLVDEARAWQALRRADVHDESRHLQAPLTALIARIEGLKLSLLLAGDSATPPPLLLGLAGIS